MKAKKMTGESEPMSSHSNWVYQASPLLTHI